MNELIIELSEISPREFFGQQNANIELLKKYFPKLKLVARGNQVKVFGDEERLEEFDKRFTMLMEHFSKYKYADDNAKSWDVQLVDTGLDTMTGGRLKRIQDRIDDTFCVTYGDGLSDLDINGLLSFHKEKKSLATLTAIHPPERYGVLNLSGDYVTEFHEKHVGESSWINGGFFVFEPEIFDYLQDGDMTTLEKKPFETLAKEQKLTAFKHNGFWHPMDTLRDKKQLEKLWTSGKAPWKIW